MTIEERAQWIIETLQGFYPHPGIPLNHQDPFTLLIAVLLSAQCTDKRVNMTTPKLFKLADNAAEMATVDLREIEKAIKSCGLWTTKARAIQTLSRILIEKFHGEVPQSREELESLPGVGRKTASVVLAQAFHIPAFPVDTHIHRCAKRWGLSQGKNVRQTEEDLKKIFPRHLWIDLHLQIIYYAREYCPAKNHSLSRCLICRTIREGD